MNSIFCLFLKIFHLLEGTSDASDTELRLKALETELRKRRTELQKLRKKKEKEKLRYKEQELRKELQVRKSFLYPHTVLSHLFNFHCFPLFKNKVQEGVNVLMFMFFR